MDFSQDSGCATPSFRVATPVRVVLATTHGHEMVVWQAGMLTYRPTRIGEQFATERLAVRARPVSLESASAELEHPGSSVAAALP